MNLSGWTFFGNFTLSARGVDVSFSEQFPDDRWRWQCSRVVEAFKDGFRIVKETRVPSSESGRNTLYSCMLRAHQTQSSMDIRRGLTYSKPSNSVWSIFPIIFLKSWRIVLIESHATVWITVVALTNGKIFVNSRIIGSKADRFRSELRVEMLEIKIRVELGLVRRR